jgi:hypothetical protein
MPHEEAKRRRIEPWERDLAKAVPDRVIREIVSDNRSRSGPSSIAATASNKRTYEDGEPQERGTGWAKEVPIRPPDGVDLIDRLVDAQDAIDRREREKRFNGE